MGVPHPSSGILAEGLDTANRLMRLQQELHLADSLSLGQKFLLGLYVPFDRLLGQR